MNHLILKKGRERSVKRRHPWIFSGAVEKAGGTAGERYPRKIDRVGFQGGQST